MPYEDFKPTLTKLTSSSFGGAMVSGLNEILILSQSNEYNFKFKFCKERVMGIPIVIYFKKNYFLIPEINNVIRNLNSAGLVEKWHYNYIDKQYLKEDDVSTGPKVITFEHLIGCFQLWACGCVIGVICFLGEIFYHRFSKRRNNNPKPQFKFVN